MHMAGRPIRWSDISATLPPPGPSSGTGAVVASQNQPQQPPLVGYPPRFEMVVPISSSSPAAPASSMQIQQQPSWPASMLADHSAIEMMGGIEDGREFLSLVYCFISSFHYENTEIFILSFHNRRFVLNSPSNLDGQFDDNCAKCRYRRRWRRILRIFHHHHHQQNATKSIIVVIFHARHSTCGFGCQGTPAECAENFEARLRASGFRAVPSGFVDSTVYNFVVCLVLICRL